LAEPFRRLVVALNDQSIDPEKAETDWSSTVRTAAIQSFESLADTFDACADELKRAADARRGFYGGLVLVQREWDERPNSIR
jgi:hypothetical protein